MPLQEQEGGGRGQACTDSDFVSGLQGSGLRTISWFSVVLFWIQMDCSGMHLCMLHMLASKIHILYTFTWQIAGGDAQPRPYPKCRGRRRMAALVK